MAKDIWKMRHALIGLVLLSLLCGCSLLDLPVAPGSPMTVGDSIANTVDTITEPTTNMVGSITTALTGNPFLAGGVAALVAGLMGMGARRLRSKRITRGGGTDSTTP